MKTGHLLCIGPSCDKDVYAGVYAGVFVSSSMLAWARVAMWVSIFKL